MVRARQLTIYERLTYPRSAILLKTRAKLIEGGTVGNALCGVQRPAIVIGTAQRLFPTLVLRFEFPDGLN